MVTVLSGAIHAAKPVLVLLPPAKLPSNTQPRMVSLTFSRRPTKPLLVMSPLPVQLSNIDEWQFSTVTFAPSLMPAIRPVAYMLLLLMLPAVLRFLMVQLPPT